MDSLPDEPKQFPTDEQSRVIADNPTPAMREKFAWLDEIHTLNRLADELRRE